MSFRFIHEFVAPDADDETVARATADYILQRPACHFAISHDVSVRARKRADWRDCPVAYDWSRKNTVGISTKDRTRAHAWIVEAMLKGYAVHHSSVKPPNGSPGSITSIRSDVREQEAAK